MRLRWLAIGTAMLVVVTACSGKTVKTESSNTTPPTTAATASKADCTKPLTSPEVGVSPTTITVTVVADTDNPIKPGLFTGSWNAVKAWGDYMNANGGLACRKIVVKQANSALSATEAKNAIAAACTDSLALVGTTALFVEDTSTLNTCKDKAGQPTGLPDLAELQTEAAQQCSPVSFPVLPGTGSCPYSGTGPRTFIVGRAQYDYYLNKYGASALHGVFVIPKDLPSTIAATMPIFRAENKLGIVSDAEFGESGTATQPSYTQVVQAMKAHNSTYARNGTDYSGTLLMRKEAQAQGVTSVKVWDCSVQCYDKRLITDAAGATEGQYVWLNILPLEDRAANQELQNLFTYEAKNGNVPDGFGEVAWLAGEVFARAVNDTLAAHGGDPNSITRANLLTAVKGIHDFTGNGMAPTIDIGAKKGSPCLVGLQVQGTSFVRVDPTEPGKFDCDGNKTVALTIDPVKEYHG